MGSRSSRGGEKVLLRGRKHAAVGSQGCQLRCSEDRRPCSSEPPGGVALAEACYVKACLYLALQVALTILELLMLEEPHLSCLTQQFISGMFLYRMFSRHIFICWENIQASVNLKTVFLELGLCLVSQLSLNVAQGWGGLQNVPFVLGMRNSRSSGSRRDSLHFSLLPNDACQSTARSRYSTQTLDES